MKKSWKLHDAIEYDAMVIDSNINLMNVSSVNAYNLFHVVWITWKPYGKSN